MAEKKYSTANNIGQSVAEGMMAFGDAMSGIYGQRGNTYGNYLESQAKRQAMEQEALRYQQQLALEQLKSTQGLYEKQQDSIAKYAQMGMRPVDPTKVISPGGNTPSRMTIGAYGQSYVPSPSMATTPIFGVGEGGQIQQMGAMPKGGKFVSPNAMMTPYEKANLPTADMKNAKVSTQQAGILLQDIKQQAQELDGGYKGIAEKGKAFLNRGKGESAKYVSYQDNVPSAAVSFYRGVTGDTRLSDADAKARALPLFWDVTQHTDVREKKFSFLERMISARESLLSSGKYKADKNGEIVIPWEDVKKEAEKINKSSEPQYEYKMVNGVQMRRKING